MSQLIVLKSILITTLMIAGSHAMEVPEKEGESNPVGNENSRESEENIDSITRTTAESARRFVEIWYAIVDDSFLKNLSLFELELLTAPNSVIPETLKVSARQKLPRASETEIRAVIQQIYKDLTTNQGF